MKETHPEGSDRNTASPTESAVCERQGREHSGADRSNKVGRYVYTRYVFERMRREAVCRRLRLVNAGGTADD